VLPLPAPGPCYGVDFVEKDGGRGVEAGTLKQEAHLVLKGERERERDSVAKERATILKKKRSQERWGIERWRMMGS
jgi:hypothetical protein